MKKLFIIITTISILISNAPSLAFALENEDTTSDSLSNNYQLSEILYSENIDSNILNDINIIKKDDSFLIEGTISEGYSLSFIKEGEEIFAFNNESNEITILEEDLNENLTITLINSDGIEEILKLQSDFMDQAIVSDSINEKEIVPELESETNSDLADNESDNKSEEVNVIAENNNITDESSEIKNEIDLEDISSKYSYPRSSEVNQKLYGDKMSDKQKQPNISLFSSPTNEISNVDYIESIAPMAIEVANQEGKPTLWPSLMIAQAIHESNFGKSGLAKSPNHNLFGIKGSYQGDSVIMKTWEVINGKNVYVDAVFRKYPSYRESFEDYANLMRNGLTWDKNYYSGTWRNNTSSVWEVLDNGGLRGYATDPNYFSKVRQYISQYNLTKYDTGNYYVRTGTFFSEGFTQRQVNKLKSSHSNLTYSIKIANDITPYFYRRIESTKEFIGASAANNALEKLVRETGWSGTIVPTSNKIQRFRVLSGYFNSQSEAIKASKDFKNTSGLSVNIEKGADNNYRLRTGYFNGYESAGIGIKYMRNMGWSARITESDDYTLYYKVRTGTFNTPGHVNQAKKYFASNNWGFYETLDPRKNHYYRIFIDGFTYKEQATNFVSYLKNVHGWSSSVLPVDK